MGFIDSSTNEYLPVFYNVVHAVGRQCPNLLNDVKLVQYLLIALYSSSEPVIRSEKPPGDLTITGVCNTTTQSWIQHFQAHVNRRQPGKVLFDGRIDRIRNKNLIGSISRTTYTLASLNRGVMKYNPNAFTTTPSLIALENPMNVPPPSNDMVLPQNLPIPSTGGF